MSRAARSSPKPSPALRDGFGELVGRDPVAAVLAVLTDAAGPLTVAAIKQAMVARGATAPAAEKAWTRARDEIRFHDHVVFEGRTFRYTAQPRVVRPGEAVYQLSKGGGAAQRARWLAIIESALAAASTDPVQLEDARTKIAEAERRITTLEEELAKLNAAPVPAVAAAAPSAGLAAGPVGAAAEPEPDPHAQFDRAERRRAARERQARIDAMSTVAELAAQVEELTAKKATAEVLLEHTRALTGDRGLEAIGRAGETSPYDETRHDPVGDVPEAGEAVTVIRPGYLWHAPGEAVLISRALVKRK